jgi:hypothetical protein
MSFQQKLKKELVEVTLATIYFAVWLGVLMVIKVLILAEYQIEFKGFSMVIIGAMVLAKVVLILEHVPLGAWTRNRPALVDVFLRTALYTLGVFIVLILEKGFEGHGEHGGFGPAVASVFEQADVYHVWAGTICVAGALLGYNLLTVVRQHLGKGGLMRLLMSPLSKASEAAVVGDAASMP